MSIRPPNPIYTARVRTMTDDEVVQAYLGGLDSDQIAFQGGMSPGTVLNILKRRDVPRRPRGNRRRPLTVPLEEVARRYQAGESALDLARAYKVSQTTIYDALDRLGVPRRHPMTGLRKLNKVRRAARVIPPRRQPTGETP